MAIIGKIREKSVLLVIIIGLALLAFILGGYEKMSMSSDEGIGYGTVFGEKIDPLKYQVELEKFETADRTDFQKQQREYTQKDQDASADKAFNFVVETSILQKEFDALGLEISDVEFDAYLYGTDGFTVMPDLAQAFVDSATGQFSPKLLQKQIERMQSSTKPEEQKSWTDSKEYYTTKRQQEKYYAILNQGVYVTKLEAEQEYVAQKEIKSISYVVRRYGEIADDKIKISEEAQKTYYEEHKTEKKYENKQASREVKYFDVTVTPSKQDSSVFNKAIEKIKSQFSTTKSDSLFVMANSDVKFFTTQKAAAFRPEGDAKAKQGMTYPITMDTVFRTASIGQIVGPYNDNGNTRIAKVLDFNTKQCKVRHILLSAPKGDTKKIAAAQTKADSIMKLLTKDNFAEYVTKYTEDPGSKDKGGVYEDFLEGEMVKEFSDFAANMPVGTIGKVKTDYGVHIIEVMDRKAVKFPVLAIIQKTLVPSQQTVDAIEDEVYSLLYKLDAKIKSTSDNVKKVALFDTIVSKAGYMARPIQIQENKPSVYGFATPFAENKILTLAFGEESVVGTLCSSPIKDKNRYVIAMLSAIHEKGVPTFEEIQKQILAELIKEEKAKRFTAQMVKKSLEECAKKGNTQVMKAEVIFANPQITGSGFEPEIAGYIFSGLKKGARSLPLKGEAGVYVIRIDKTTKAPATANYTVEREQLLANQKGAMAGQARAALMKKADIVDNRRFNQIGIRR